MTLNDVSEQQTSKSYDGEIEEMIPYSCPICKHKSESHSEATQHVRAQHKCELREIVLPLSFSRRYLCIITRGVSGSEQE